MSAGQVDILVKAREDAISTLKAVQAEIRNTGTVSEQTLAAYKDTRSEVMLSQRSLTTLTMAYREQYESVYLAGRAFSDISSIIGRVLNMYEQYNVAMIRQNQIQKEVTTAQDKYNAALLKYGPASTQAISALSELTSAQNALGDAQQKNTAMLVGFAAQIPGFIGPVLNAVVAMKVLVAYMSATGAAATESAAGMGIQASAALADAAAIDTATASMASFTAAEAISGIGLAVAGVVALTYWFSLHLTPAVQGATKSLMDFEGGMARARMGTKDSLEITKQVTTAAEDQAIALQTQLTWILNTADAETRQTAATKELTAEYASGKITAAAFSQAMLNLGVSASDIAKILAGTTVEVKTWQEQFVASAQEAATAFKEAFTGPMAQLGPATSTAMANLVNITISAIDSGFIGQAQAGFQAFKDCVSGKMNDLPGMQQQTMDSIVSITNAAINNGLRGTAQEGIALYVQCATSKQLSMVQEIDGYLKQLQGNYDQNNKTILTLTAQGKTAEAQLYTDANLEIKAAIDQLKTWRTEAVTGVPATIPITVTVDTTAASAALDAFVNVGSRGWQRSNKGAGASSIVVPVTADNADALAKIADVGTALDTLNTHFYETVLELIVDGSQALGTITAVQGRLDAVRDKTVTITVNYVSSGNPPRFQYGGIVPEDMLAFVHKGEEVIPASQVASSSPSGRASSAGPSAINFQNQTVVQVDGETVQRSMEMRMIRNRQVGSRYG